jgi:hypothetical protein
MIKVVKAEQETRRTIDDRLEHHGVLSTVEDFVCGFWMGCNWPTTKWYQMNWEMPALLKNAGGYNTCNHVARKYGLDMDLGLKPVTDVSTAATAGYYTGWGTYVGATAAAALGAFVYPPILIAAPPVLRGIRSLIQGIFIAPFLPKEG